VRSSQLLNVLITTSDKTSMSFIVIIGPKYTLAALNAAP